MTLVEASGAMHEADAEIGTAGVTQAATTALVAAARRMNLGAGVELRVRSTPDGALVVVDGTDVGVTPFVGVFEAGDHQVEVRLRGEEDIREVTLVDDAVTVEAVLGGEGNSDPGLDGRAPTTVPSVWNDVLGWGAIAGGAVALIAGPIQALARSGEVTEPMGPDGEPGQQVSFGGSDIALTVIAAALVAGGVTMLVLKPIPTETGDLAGATLTLTGSF
ncbi:MAG: hypothetical protein DRJ42_26695 [Deltaproteobacteria bacterium]|nr:MAG: hypothetical protein DRJ42_26695 [Deltaproteobacteria bacterium]